MDVKIKRLNLQTYEIEKLTDNPITIPTLIKDEQLKLWQDDDKNPYFKLVQFKYPIVANGETYPESYFETYLNKLTDHPIPGGKFGHETRYMATGPTDFVVIGGRINKQGDGTGTATLKLYIPPKGDNGDNDTFIKANKSGMVHFSMVSYVRQERLNDGQNFIVNNVESHHGERLDAVGWGEGAMKQVTNAADSQKINTKGLSNARALINAGKVDNSRSWSWTGADGNKLLGANGDDWANYSKWFFVEDTSATEDTKARWKYPFGKNGMVFRSALRAIASRASAEGLQKVSDTASELIVLIDKKKKSSGQAGRNNSEGGIQKMDKAEILKQLKAISTEKITLEELAGMLGETEKLATPEHIEALKVMNALKQSGISDPVKEIGELKKIKDENEKLVSNKMIETEFDVDHYGKDILFQYAEKQLSGKVGATLRTAIDEMKKNDPIARHLAGQRVDMGSDMNKLAFVDSSSGKPPENTGVDKV